MKAVSPSAVSVSPLTPAAKRCRPSAATSVKSRVRPITGPSARPAQAAALYGVHISTIWRWTKELPDFPRPRKVGTRTTLFVLAELIAYRDKSLEC